MDSRLSPTRRETLLFKAVVVALVLSGCFAVAWKPAVIIGDYYLIYMPLYDGSWIRPITYPHLGRFMPLEYQDFNLVLPFSDPLTAVAVLEAIKFALAAWLTWKAFRVFMDEVPACVAVLVTLTASDYAVAVFSNPSYPEPTIIVYLAFFLWQYADGAVRGNRRGFILAFATAVIGSYLKEPVFGIFAVFALTNLLQLFRQLSATEKRFAAGLIANAFVYLTVYYFMAYRHQEIPYVQERRFASLQMMFLLFCDRAFWLPVILPVLRVFFCLRERRLIVLRSDAVAAAGLAYGTGFVILQLEPAYYYAPAQYLLLAAAVCHARWYWLNVMGAPAVTAPLRRAALLGLAIAACVAVTGFYRDFKHLKTESTKALALLDVVVAEGYTPLIWYPPYEPGKNRMMWEYGRLFIEILPVYYNLFTHRPNDMARFHRVFFDEVLKGEPDVAPPVAVTADFNEFLDTRSVLLPMLDFREVYDNKPWTAEPGRFVEVPGDFTFIFKKEDIPALAPVVTERYRRLGLEPPPEFAGSGG
jgi:hypothetical protein